METTRYVVDKEGMFMETVNRSEIEITDSIAEAFTESMTRPIKNVLRYGGIFGDVAVTVAGKGYAHWSVQVLTLPLRCCCNTENGVVVPVFDSKQCPLLPMKWKVPGDMRLVLGVTSIQNPEYKHYFGGLEQFLVAFDSNNRMYRLPTSNLFADCGLCHNMPEVHHQQAMGVVRQACEQFEKSEWNAHLYNDTTEVRRQCTKQMFRWKPTEDTFEQLPMILPEGRDWTALCEKIAVDKLNSIIIPPEL